MYVLVRLARTAKLILVVPKTIRIHGVEYYIILSCINKKKDKSERGIMTTVVVAIEDDKNKQIQKTKSTSHAVCIVVIAIKILFSRKI